MIILLCSDGFNIHCLLQIYAVSTYGIVLFMRTDKFNVHPTCGVKDGNYQAVIVSLNVKYHAIIFQDVRIAVLSFNISWRFP
ncbi:hypothetical protein XCR1_1180001 [Xenorhabdus cabanillasii JM26]|uniref:Uncharacterized protein n=1 Tax=Xenorhabdus cabanillasii JM26 TaxID=1427517 RepID=W1IQS6_9GAMM|nr:hypothetical protein XCR1_1180001 [Xenorhabdus cabanillasii JM26]